VTKSEKHIIWLIVIIGAFLWYAGLKGIFSNVSTTQPED